jgi:glycerol uptake facilitator-like aquaporin
MEEESNFHLIIHIRLSKTVGLLNPFFLIGTQTITIIYNGYKDPEHLLYALILCGAEFLGSILAALFFKFIFYRNLSKWRN